MHKQAHQAPHPASGIQQAHDRAIRLPEVVQITGRSKTMIYEDSKAGRFPPGFLIGRKARAWSLKEINEWLESRKAGRAV